MRLALPDLERHRLRLVERGGGLLLALLVELLVALLLLTLSPSPKPQPEQAGLVTFDAAPDRPPAEPAEPPAPANPSPPQPERAAEPPRPAPPPRPSRNATPALPWIPLSRDQLAAADIAAPPAATAAPAPMMGPPDIKRNDDTPRVEGSGPNGEPLYAAAWYREPYDSELSGYLSTATGPGWGLIACKTVPDFRVDDCVALGEYPERSGIARAVLAAAWQFRVRPPMLRGQYRVGEWVRIRIDYSIRGR